MFLIFVIAFAILLWMAIYGGRLHVKWTRHEGITFTVSLYSPKRGIRPKANETTE